MKKQLGIALALSSLLLVTSAQAQKASDYVIKKVELKQSSDSQKNSQKTDPARIVTSPKPKPESKPKPGKEPKITDTQQIFAPAWTQLFDIETALDMADYMDDRLRAPARFIPEDMFNEHGIRPLKWANLSPEARREINRKNFEFLNFLRSNYPEANPLDLSITEDTPYGISWTMAGPLAPRNAYRYLGNPENPVDPDLPGQNDPDPLGAGLVSILDGVVPCVDTEDELHVLGLCLVNPAPQTMTETLDSSIAMTGVLSKRWKLVGNSLNLIWTNTTADGAIAAAIPGCQYELTAAQFEDTDAEASYVQFQTQIPTPLSCLDNVDDVSGIYALTISGQFSTCSADYDGDFCPGVENQIRYDSTNEDVSQFFFIEVPAQPSIAFVHMRPTANLSDPENPPVNIVETEAELTAEELNIVVKLTQGNERVRLLAEVFDENDELYSSSVITELKPFGNDAPFRAQPGESIIGYYDFNLRLKSGQNRIRVTAQNLYVLERADSIDLEDIQFELDVFNAVGGPEIQVADLDSGALFELPENGEGLNLPVQFCLTSILTQGIRGNGEDCVEEFDSQNVGVDVYLNDIQLSQDSIGLDNGQFSFNIQPEYGINFLEISTYDKRYENLNDNGEVIGYADYAKDRKLIVFAAGRVLPYLVDGEVNQNEEDLPNTFPAKGLSVKIHNRMIQSQILPVLQRELNRPSRIKDFLLGLSSDEVQPTSICGEVGGNEENHGDSSLEFLEESIEVGGFQVLELRPSSRTGMLHLRARLTDFHADLDLRGLGLFDNIGGAAPDDAAEEFAFIPLRLDIERMDINVGVRFVRNNRGKTILDIVRVNDDTPVLSIVGSGPFGAAVQVDSSRNVLMEGLEALDRRTGLISGQFPTTLESTLLCGVENDLNRSFNFDDLIRLVGFRDDNPLRLNLPIDLFGKSLELDTALNLLDADISFQDSGIIVENLPLRASPSQNTFARMELLKADAEEAGEPIPEFAKGPLFRQAAELIQMPQLIGPEGLLGEQSLGLALSEDLINNFLYAVNQEGLLDLSITPNFYTENEAIPNPLLPSTNSALTQGFDIDHDGRTGISDVYFQGITENEAPIEMQITTSKKLSPMLTFLSAAEIEDLADRYEASDPNAEFDRSQRYFKFVLPEFEIAFYALEPVGPANGGYGTFCEAAESVSEDAMTPDLARSPEDVGACKISGKPIRRDDACVGNETPYIFPTANGQRVSADPNASELMPIARVKYNLRMYGWFVGVNRQASVLDIAENPAPIEELLKNLLRVRLLPPPAPIDGSTDQDLRSFEKLDFEVLYQAPGANGDGIASGFVGLLKPALFTECQNLNEIRIELPDRFPALPEEDEEGSVLYPEDSLGATLCEYGIDHLQLTLNEGENGIVGSNTNLFLDDQGLFLDLVTDLAAVNEGDSCPEREEEAAPGGLVLID